MNNRGAPLHTERREEFDIAFYALPEDEAPEDCFDEEGDETAKAIREGRYDWFCACVTASRAGIELGVDYLGACCYDSASDFPTDSGYYEGMVSTAISEARLTLARLNEATP